MTNEEILEAISNMSVLELSELVKAIEDKFGVSAAAPVAVAAAPAAGAAAAAEEKDRIRRSSQRNRRKEDPGYQSRS